MSQLSDESKVVVCTGSGRLDGLGAGILERFAREGYRLVVSDIGLQDADSKGLASSDDMNRVADYLGDLGAEVLCIPCDVRSPESVENLMAEIMLHFGRLDVLVNNAGIGFVMKHSNDIQPTEWQWVIDVTLTGVFLCSQGAAKHMIDANIKGRIINIASQAAKSGFPHMAPYCAAKHGVLGLTRTQAIDYGAYGITVNAVCPNHVTTGLGGAQNEYFAAFRNMTVTDYLEDMASRIPVKRIGQVSDTAAMVAFLASDEASFITGETINVSGGEEMH
jgi:NAD(P)-dependent dehydrogenase (short-subunit alcohol dehydrogenase family)